MTAEIGRWLMGAGAVIMLAGAALWLAGRMGLPLGALPGDIHARGDGWSFHFPIVTCIAVSVALTLILNLLFRLFR